MIFEIWANKAGICILAYADNVCYTVFQQRRQLKTTVIVTDKLHVHTIECNEFGNKGPHLKVQ